MSRGFRGCFCLQAKRRHNQDFLTKTVKNSLQTGSVGYAILDIGKMRRAVRDGGRCDGRRRSRGPSHQRVTDRTRRIVAGSVYPRRVTAWHCPTVPMMGCRTETIYMVRPARIRCRDAKFRVSTDTWPDGSDHRGDPSCAARTKCRGGPAFPPAPGTAVGHDEWRPYDGGEDGTDPYGRRLPSPVTLRRADGFRHPQGYQTAVPGGNNRCNECPRRALPACRCCAC